MDALVEYIAQIVLRLTQTQGLSEDEALRQALLLARAAREAYWEAGAPLGDTDAGFIAWLQPHRKPPRA